MNADYCPFCNKVYGCGERNSALIRRSDDKYPITLEACGPCWNAIRAWFRGESGKEADDRERKR